jgi:hypothetical protein
VSDLSRRFLDFSSTVTAFTVYDLQGTGQADSYLSCVLGVVGEKLLTELLDASEAAASLARDVLSDEKLGPVARSVIKLWYVGIWYELPPEWTESFGPLENDGTFTASPNAYPEGLLWRAIGANPPGARAPGYASWALPPVIPPISGEEEPAAVSLTQIPSQRGVQPDLAKEIVQ